MKKILATIFATFLLFSAQTGFAADNGTADEAKALVEAAIAKIKSDGKENAFKAFESKNGGFIDRDLYIFVFDMAGLTLSHGTNKGLIGKNLVKMNLKDPDGKKFIDAFIATAKTKGEGWVDYKWVNPTTKKIEQKSSFVKKVDSTMFVGCGIYK